MADINIQRKKNSPSPWLLILLVLAVVGVAAWLLLRAESPAPTEPAASAVTTPAPARPDSSTGAETGPRPPADAAVADMAPEPAPVTPEVLAAFAGTDAAQPTYALEGLRLLTAALVDLADRDDLRTTAIGEKRDNLTSATARLNEPGASLRPGFVAATGLLQAMQQQTSSAMEPAVADLITRATQLSGHNDTATDHQQLQEFFSRAATVLRTLSESAPASA